MRARSTRWIGVAFLLVAGLFGSLQNLTAAPGDAPLGQMSATQTAAALTATAMVTPATTTPVPTATSTPVPPTATQTGLVDLQVFKTASRDPVDTNDLLTYTVTVFNASFASASSPATTLIDIVPSGTVLTTPPATCSTSGSFPGATISCPVPSLFPNQSVTFTFTVQVTATTGMVISNTAQVDPNNIVIETNEGNNFVTLTTTVGATVVPTSTTGPAIPTATIEPAQPAPPAPTAVPPAAGTTWVRILAPQQTYSVTEDLLWIAQPGELYWVSLEEGGWLLVVWEGDTRAWSVWIRDQAVERLAFDRPAPPEAGQLWLVVFELVQAVFQDGSRAWIAAPGEWYEVLRREGGWVLGRWEFDPPSVLVWIPEGPQIEFATFDAPR